MYAIVDIETTGGKYNEEGITEIAIYQYDGNTLTDQFCSLVNPERPIQPFVVNLTGINSQMLKNAPKFYEVAKRIIEITEGCVLVAHNATFDYRILQTEFDRLGYDFEKKTLCTVELSKKLIPGLPSYSLGKLVRSIGIPISSRHRAQGDAKATLELFKLLLAKDVEKEIIKTSVKNTPKKQVQPNLLAIIEELPEVTGVYYMHKEDGTIIYIGKSKNIKKRVSQHFTAENKKSKQIQLEVATVTYEETGSDLIAQLKENHEIKQNKPKYNHALKRAIFQYQLTSFKDTDGYIQLKTEKINDTQAITTFTNIHQAKSFLYKATETYKLCQKLTGLHKTKTSCFLFSVKQCNGACIHKEDPNEYNTRVQALIEKYTFLNKSFLIVDKGREIDEHALVLIENGVFKGFGYYNLNFQINNPEIIASIITPMKQDRDVQHIIQTFLRKNNNIKIIPLTAEKKS